MECARGTIMSWQFLNTGAHDGQFNMDVDVDLARSLQQGSGNQTLRLYRWRPYAISLGFNQQLDEIDTDACAACGIDVVRRPTGGRAILHAEELTYSVVMFSQGKNTMEVYHRIGSALVRGLRKLDPEIHMGRTEPDFSALYRQPSSISCFSSTARYEIQYRGKKLAGSAQRRFPAGTGDQAEVVLQHGSILIGPEHRRLAEFIRNGKSTVESIRQTLAEKTTELSTIMQRPVSSDEVAGVIRMGFEEEWNIAFEHSSITSVPV
jgi:lipoate-protein ligase A